MTKCILKDFSKQNNDLGGDYELFDYFMGVAEEVAKSENVLIKTSDSFGLLICEWLNRNGYKNSSSIHEYILFESDLRNLLTAEIQLLKETGGCAKYWLIEKISFDIGNHYNQV